MVENQLENFHVHSVVSGQVREHDFDVRVEIDADFGIEGFGRIPKVVIQRKELILLFDEDLLGLSLLLCEKMKLIWSELRILM